MAQYKVPQDVEADDKLLGPFTFRQFVYLLITAALVGILIFLFQLFPVLAIIPLPFIALFGALALPIKKDQPMETYLAAVISYYLKPRTRTWTPGQKETTIQITAPKIIEDKKTRDITGEEATHRLSFLADIVDTQGQAVNAFNNSTMRDDLVAEAASTADMFEDNRFDTLNIAIEQTNQARHDELMKKMRSAIAENEAFQKVEIKPIARPASTPVASQPAPTQSQPAPVQAQPVQPQPAQPAPVQSVPQDPTQFRIPSMPAAPAVKEEIMNSPVVVQPSKAPEIILPEPPSKPSAAEEVPESEDSQKNINANQPKDDMINLANNANDSVDTITKEAKNVNERKEDGEVFVSLH